MKMACPESNGEKTAFPFVVDGFETDPGLTKRELFAAMAMQAIITSDALNQGSFDDVHEYAVAHADALLVELEK